MKATEKSDVYSMGIVLVELVTGRMPTDERFGVEMDVVRWVETGMESGGGEELVDPRMKPLLPDELSAMLQVLEIAMRCTKTAPSERPTSRQACDQLVRVLNDAVVPSGKISPDAHVYV